MFGNFSRNNEDFDAAKLDRIRRSEEKRRMRIFNEKWRLIGLDEIALQNQIEEQRKQKDERNRRSIEAEKAQLDRERREFERMCAIEKIRRKRNRSIGECNMQLANEQRRRMASEREALRDVWVSEEFFNKFNSSSR